MTHEDTTEKPIEFASDHALAEAQHGEMKKQCLNRIEPESEGRWFGTDGARALAELAWESGWDEALLAAERWMRQTNWQGLAAKAAAQERAAVVAWLIERHNNTSYLDVIRMVIKQFSRSIEQGEHWPTEESNELG